ncbi:MAG: antibiotic biosynthesis monooxygenase [Roseibium sp.]|uniref:antibiotic biosynthesis monooxygenase family protein n=1 Tax=Roseibium sp. TaxID=1936156 RepID=UPI00261A86FA|nr:antibiotic biosynthesis monooxygenase family protein [Roseibium sp.]MCV0426132.1 antibiotic biosynthesis monooxygenase [Roseibium sp.]
MFSKVTRRALNLTAAAALLGFAAAPAKADETEKVEPVTLINAFEVSAGQLEETILFWEKARDFLQTQPGYISTRLHQSLSPDAKFQLVNVALWESPEAFQSATQKMRDSGLGSGKRENVFHAALYKVVRTDARN